MEKIPKPPRSFVCCYYSSQLLSGSSETACDPGIKKRKLSSWLKETIELKLSSSTRQNPEQKMKKESQDCLQLP